MFAKIALTIFHSAAFIIVGYIAIPLMATMFASSAGIHPWVTFTVAYGYLLFIAYLIITDIW